MAGELPLEIRKRFTIIDARMDSEADENSEMSVESVILQSEFFIDW